MKFKHITKIEVIDEMKIKHITNIPEFFEVIDSCTGKVELVGEDIRLNLKSKLSQYIGLAEVFSAEENEIPELDIVTYNYEDANKLIDYMINNR